jgi:melanoma-associated antigen
MRNRRKGVCHVLWVLSFILCQVGASAKQYIVRSTLDSELIQVACTVDEDIQAQEQEDAGDSEAPISGSILAWQIHDQIPAYGTLCVILSLILVNGKTIPDGMSTTPLYKYCMLTSTNSNSPISVEEVAAHFD